MEIRKSGQAIFFVSLLLILLLIIITNPKIIYIENLLNPVDYIIWGMDHHKERKFHLIKIGMTGNEVIKILGEPEEIIRDPEIKQYHGNRDLYGKAIPNPNKAFLYSTGIDYLALYVFDNDNRVAFINIGGT